MKHGMTAREANERLRLSARAGISAVEMMERMNLAAAVLRRHSLKLPRW